MDMRYLAYDDQQFYASFPLNFGLLLAVSRHPIHWGWFCQTANGVWSSFPLLPRGDDPAMEDGQVEDMQDHTTLSRMRKLDGWIDVDEDFE